MPYSARLRVPRQSLRIAVVQFAPKIGQVQRNIEKARKYCESLVPGTVDLLCLPEMIFTGYAFESASAILPFLEHPQRAPRPSFAAGAGAVVDVVGANSAVLYGPDGTRVGHYRKSHLFYMDKVWAKPGPGFATFHLPAPLNTVTLAICMDLNPRSPSWTIDGGPYELAEHCLKTGSSLLICHLASNGNDDGSNRGEEDVAAAAEPPRNISEDTETVVVVCNRRATFAGSSALFRLRQSARQPSLAEYMTRRQEGVCVWTT
ncbi:carbon-nitrogen hydrolase [Russula vinacea]|nr:carbon-nitrogen hydrolase [Russula vinacea]